MERIGSTTEQTVHSRTGLRSFLVLTAALASAIPLAVGPAAAVPPGSGQPATGRPQPRLSDPLTVRTVTLITGDVLQVSGESPQRVTFTRTPGREHITFATRTVRGHLQVTPSDAVPLISAGTVDPALFDVTSLLKFGYDDRRQTLPIIVSSAARAGVDPAAVRAKVAAAHAELTRTLPTIQGYAVQQNRAHAVDHWKSLTGAGTGARAGIRMLSAGIGKIWLDAVQQPTLDVSVPQVGAPSAWQAGYDGAGVPVGVADSGIDDTHPDLAGTVLEAQNFTSEPDLLDHTGHGTHVASTIAGSGAASQGRFKGVAPGTKLFSAKVCTDSGCPNSAIIAGMTWLAQTKHAKIVNLSLGGPDTPGIDPVEDAVSTLTEKYGTLFVIASGNEGYTDLWSTVATPGTAADALTVGAVTKSDQAISFSGRGPRPGDFSIKPDITAPGVDITAAKGRDGYKGTPSADGLYATMSGTSMATPHVVGAAAIVAQQHPTWSPAQLKAGLMGSAKASPALNVFQQGAGRVDVGRAITQAVTTTPASLSFGRLTWPHADDESIARTLTYHNPTTAALTLSLALNTKDETGKPTASGLFALSTATLSVPAGGAASVVVTADGRKAGSEGHAGGELTATTGSGVVVQTPLGIDVEVESYDVDIVYTTRSGQPAGIYTSFLAEASAAGDNVSLYDADGTVQLRLPKGKYILDAIIHGDEGASLLAVPQLLVDHDQTVVMDARTAKPNAVTVAKPGYTSMFGGVAFSQPDANDYQSGVYGSDLTRIFTAQIGPTDTVPGFVSNISGQWAKPDAQGSLINTPDTYGLSYYTKGRLRTGFSRTLTERNTATVHSDLAAEALGAQGALALYGSPVGVPTVASGGASLQYDLPRTATAHVNTDSGVLWRWELTQGIPELDDPLTLTALTRHESGLTAYRSGRSYREPWNTGVFGPGLHTDVSQQSRVGDTLIIGAPLFADGAGRVGASRGPAVTTLSRDGVTLTSADAVFGVFTVPADPGRYTVTTRAARPAPFTLSTRSTRTWSFNSAHVDETAYHPLPLSVVRFTPVLDRTNTAVPARTNAAVPARTNTAVPAPMLRIPVSVQRVADSGAGPVQSLTVAVSVDDGKIWTSLPVLRSGDNGVVQLKRPAGTGFVSLKAELTDTAGNTCAETIVRAFRF
jgi:subtilisin family serine protease